MTLQLCSSIPKEGRRFSLLSLVPTLATILFLHLQKLWTDELLEDELL